MRTNLKENKLLGRNRDKKANVVLNENQRVRCSRCQSVLLIGNFAGHKCLRTNWKKPHDQLEALLEAKRKAIKIS